MLNQYLVATRYALLEHARNRFALGLLLVFVPLWFFAIGSMIPNDPVAFKLASTGALLQVNGHQLTVLTAGFNALTLIMSFMIFAATLRGREFDRRLTLSGYAQPMLLLAKLTALAVVALVVAGYATAVLALGFWHPQAVLLVGLGYAADALIYGALGLLLGVLVTSELAGFFTLIMVSLMDTFLQAPVENPLANKPVLAFFPTYGPMQVSVAGGFTHAFPVGALGLALAWFAGFALVGLGIFAWRTHAWGQRKAPHGRIAPAPASALS
jgi:ABC-2 type transport system permease protein